jgi:oligopeptide/dipeptide ABC transporter ATP-binding protein
MALLEVEHLDVAYELKARTVYAVRDVSLKVEPGEFLGIVGESGCGKSTLGFAIARLLRPPARLTGGTVVFRGDDISQLSGERLRRTRRNGLAVVLQSGMNALNPVRNLEHHFHDVIAAHERVSMRESRRRAVELLEKVSLQADILDRYPHELSGGMRQRLAIALVLSLQPSLVIFDEPTTALDVITQRKVMETIQALQREEGFAAMLISHDLGIVLDAADRVLVMYAGKLVEDQPAQSALRDPRHPYMRALLDCYADPRADVVDLRGIPGAPPDLARPLVHQCPFHPRCPLAEPICLEQEPELLPAGPGLVACHVARRVASKEEASLG